MNLAHNSYYICHCKYNGLVERTVIIIVILKMYIDNMVHSTKNLYVCAVD